MYVEAYNDDGAGPPSSTVTARTKVAGKDNASVGCFSFYFTIKLHEMKIVGRKWTRKIVKQILRVEDRKLFALSKFESVEWRFKCLH